MLERVNKACNLFNETYNANYLTKYPDIKNIFFDVRNLYEKKYKKFPNANKTFMSLVYNLANPEKQPVVDYLTGPSVISKWESTKYNKVIYLFGENDHSNKTGCIQSKINLQGKKHMKIEQYLMDLFKHSPVFIDFYVELDLFIDKSPLEFAKNDGNNTLNDILYQMKGCFGPLIERKCPYNVRMHSVDVRRIKSDKFKKSKLGDMFNFFHMWDYLTSTEYMNTIYNPGKVQWIQHERNKFKDQINIMSKVKNIDDIFEIIFTEISNNNIINKELSRSIISKQKIVDIYKIILKTDLKILNSSVKYKILNPKHIGPWFERFKTINLTLDINDKFWDDLNNIFLFLKIINAVTVDVYTTARMFKVFDVKENEHYPKEPHNIIYYAGSGHTRPMGDFLQNLGFIRTEHSDNKTLSCASMKGITQPLFS